MALTEFRLDKISTILKRTVIRTKGDLAFRNKLIKQQKAMLKKLISKAKSTQIGKKYNFQAILKSKNFVEQFQQSVPVYDYETILNEWWNQLFEGKKDICWPGKIRYFALTSGTSAAASKKIPVTKEMIQSIRRTGIRQLMAIKDLKLPASFYQSSVLMVGGSTNLYKVSDYLEGDLSGIMQSKLPFWFSIFYKPGKPIAMQRDWDTKLEQITRNAHKWDIGAIAGVPAWVQLLIERIIKYYNLRNIHELWPNLSIYVHGGVCLSPYIKRFESLLGKDIHYLETYLASEGFIAYQKKNHRNMQLVPDLGIFFEFIPFNDKNFNADGQLLPKPETYTIADVKEGEEYAILLSTVAGCWRYLIGDTIRFTNAALGEIVITGRTKHFLSLCGEHLSVDNMTQAIRMLSDELNIDIREFTVAGIPYNGLFAHKWYIGTDVLHIKEDVVQKKLDGFLKQLNDDYAVERKAALSEVIVQLLPVNTFYDFLKSIGKEGGQNKFPRVLKGKHYDEWESYLSSNLKKV